MSAAIGALTIGTVAVGKTVGAAVIVVTGLAKTTRVLESRTRQEERAVPAPQQQETQDGCRDQQEGCGLCTRRFS